MKTIWVVSGTLAAVGALALVLSNESEAQAQQGGGSLAELDRYVGHYAHDRVGGALFHDHPGLVAALTRAGVTAAQRRDLEDLAVRTPIEKQGDVIVESGCMPRNCSDQHYRIYANTRTQAAALCLYDTSVADTATWWGAPRGPFSVGNDCPNTWQEAPSAIRTALGTAGGTAVASAPAAAPALGSGLPDITAALTFDDPATCYSEALTQFAYGLTEQQTVGIGARPRLRVTRTGPTREGYYNASAPVGARWNGLVILRIEHEWLPDTDSNGTTIVFAGQPATIGATLARLGFPVRRPGDSWESAYEDFPTLITLEVHGNETHLDCMH